MQNLVKTLAAYDLELIRIIANRWDTELTARDAAKAAEQVATAMLRPEKAADVWSRLPDDQRGALQTLLGSKGSMPVAIFSRTYGEIRQMGPERLVKEKPHLQPASIAEGLYYRGMIALGSVKMGKGVQHVVYVPTDLAALLPAHMTGYGALAKEEPAPPKAPAPRQTGPDPENVRAADTSIVDDLTTLLAACQIENLPLTDGLPTDEYREGLSRFLIGPSSPVRFAMLVAIALELGLAEAPDGRLKPVPAAARKWLDSPRPVQVRALAEGWQRAASYNELRYVPGLKVEKVDNDPLLARQSVCGYLEAVPPAEWWPVEEMVEAIKEDDTDFLRPDGDYNRWYIRDASNNKYLRGFESWPKVEGALLRFILTGPMHMLGLVDLGANDAVCRLTAYGRALVGLAEWPTHSPNEGVPIKVEANGVCKAPRAANRYERFQLARFTDWQGGVSQSEPYQYRLTAEGVARGRAQGLRPDQILAFLRRITGDALPEAVARQVELWGQAEANTVEISQALILRVPTEAMLETILNTPALRRYLGATLGPTAVLVRPKQWEALAAALRENGLRVDHTDLDDKR